MSKNVKITVKIDVTKLKNAEREVKVALRESFEDCVDDLVRVSSETAPHDKGILEKSHSKEITGGGDKIEATIDYSVKEKSSKGAYNYALAMHEMNYNLGHGSLAKPGGTGMSGKNYSVGNKFLTRPLEGEKEAYKEHIEKSIQDKLKT